MKWLLLDGRFIQEVHRKSKHFNHAFYIFSIGLTYTIQYIETYLKKNNKEFNKLLNIKK